MLVKGTLHAGRVISCLLLLTLARQAGSIEEAVEPDSGSATRRVVTLQLTGIGSTHPVTVVTPIGRAAVYRDYERSLFLSITPTRVDPASGQLTFQVDRLQEVDLQLKTIADLGQVQGPLGHALFAKQAPELEIKPLAVLEAPPAELMACPGGQAHLGFSCCVTCANTEACGLRVSSTCGSCGA